MLSGFCEVLCVLCVLCGWRARGFVYDLGELGGHFHSECMAVLR